MSAEKLILVVEDNLDTSTLIRRALGKSGIPSEVVVVADDSQARDFLYGIGTHQGRDLDRPPDLILLDVNLPKLSGLDLLRLIRIQPRTKYVPVVVFTSSVQERDLEAAYGRGANSYVRKPVDFGEFSTALQTVATYWLTLNHRPRSSPASASVD